MARSDLTDLLQLSVPGLTRTVQGMASAIARNDRQDLNKARGEFVDRVLVSRVLGDLLGREKILHEVGVESKPVRLFALATTTRVAPNVPPVTFEEAIASLIRRTPMLAGSAEQVRMKHAQGAFVLLRSTSDVLTRKVQEILARSIREGEPRGVTQQVLQQLGGFSRAYSETVYRTNLSTAFNDGQFEQASAPEIQELDAAFRYDAVLDSDVRPNHRAADGFVARTTDRIWSFLTPPLGFNCRCQISLVTGATNLPRHKPPPPGAGPDEGFR